MKFFSIFYFKHLSAVILFAAVCFFHSNPAWGTSLPKNICAGVMQGVALQSLEAPAAAAQPRLSLRQSRPRIWHWSAIGLLGGLMGVGQISGNSYDPVSGSGPFLMGSPYSQSLSTTSKPAGSDLEMRFERKVDPATGIESLLFFDPETGEDLGTFTLPADLLIQLP